MNESESDAKIGPWTAETSVSLRAWCPAHYGLIQLTSRNGGANEGEKAYGPSVQISKLKSSVLALRVFGFR